MSEKILVLTLSFGSGHVSAAHAVAQELRRQLPSATVRVVDALEKCPLVFRAFYVWTYWLMIRRAPRLWKRFFETRVDRRDQQTAPVWALRWGFATGLEEITAFQPQLILACEVAACEIAVIARRDYLTTANIINVITDFEAEPIWVKPEIAAFAVATGGVGEQLISWGAASDKINVCGIPLDASFSIQHDAQDTRAQFNLDRRPLVLLMGGGMGPTNMHEVAARLLRNDAKLQIVALPGKDRKARRRLQKLKSTPNSDLKILGWTTQVAALMQTAQILVTKPGGVTLAEAAAAALPIVLFDAIPGPEEINAKQFVETGAGILTRGAAETAQAVVDLLEDAERLAEMSRKIKKMARPAAAREIARLAIETRCAGENQFTESKNRFAVGV